MTDTDFDALRFEAWLTDPACAAIFEDTKIRPTHKGQQQVADLRETIGDKWPHPDAFDSWAFLITEVGELGDALLRRGYGALSYYVRNNPREADLAKELGDVYLMLCTLATRLEIDLGEALQERVTYLKEKHG